MQARGSRVAALVAVLVATLIAAIAWATWEGLRADRGEAPAASVHGPDPSRGRIALGLLLAVAAGLAGAMLIRWVRASEQRPAAAVEPRSNRATLQAVLDGTTDAMILADPLWRIRLINPAAEILFGRLDEDLTGTGVAGLLPGLSDHQDPAALDAPIAAAGDATMAPVVHETEARRADGQRFPVRLWVRGLPLDGGQYLLITVHDISEQDRQGRELAYLRSHDPLTGLLNRQELRTRLATLTSVPSPGSRDAGPLPGTVAAGQARWILCHIDLDQFIVINSTCGSGAGDKLLQQMARLIEAKLTQAELVARLGGDEFAALLPGRDLDAAIDLCEALMQTVRGFLFTWHDRSFDIASSIGMASWDPLAEPPDDALGRAEMACQLAKRGGRNRIHVYREGEAELIRLRGDMHLVSTINQALSDGRFSLFAQPIVPLTGSPPTDCHFEILVRMVDDKGALVVPARFIPAAEHYILMPAVDRWIISRLFALQGDNLRAWHRTNPDQFLFAVNLSGTTVTDDGFLRYLQRQFDDWHIPYPSICFEITETAAVGSLEQARTLIQEMSARGCRFALDDFGTGLSSYAYLRALGVHYLKIDGTFVRGVATDPINRAMVQSINHIGHILGLKTIAEWVEDEDTLAMVRTLGLDYAQGYAVGAGVPLAEFTLADPTTACRFGRPKHERSPGLD
jgi:diguanylate cyclase (GGDEF)-like protein/PAS domain S-box-containing protein